MRFQKFLKPDLGAGFGLRVAGFGLRVAGWLVVCGILPLGGGFRAAERFCL
jgi:hypothetical protein